MFKSFEEAFTAFMRNRAGDIADKVSQNDHKYAANRKKTIELYGEIEDMLPDGYKKLGRQLEDYETSCSTIMIDSVYEQVLVDAIALLKIFGLMPANELCSEIKNYTQTEEGVA